MSRQVKERHHPRRGEDPGFTLLELLVVIAIIGLLIAILIPSLQLAQEAGNELVCKTQLDQLFKGAFVYTEQEGDDRLPYFAWMDARPMPSEWWVTQVGLAMEGLEPSIYRCPNDSKPHQKSQLWKKGGSWHMSGVPVPDGPGTLTRITLPLTYRGSCDNTDYENLRRARRINDYRLPDEAILLMEGSDLNSPSQECIRFLNLGLLTRSSNSVNPALRTWTRHSGTSNVLFLDGHIDRLSPIEVGETAAIQEYKIQEN